MDFGQKEPFVVAEGDVVFRAVLFDELAFEEEGLGLVADLVVFEVPDALDEGAGFVFGESAFNRFQPLQYIPAFQNFERIVQ